MSNASSVVEIELGRPGLAYVQRCLSDWTVLCGEAKEIPIESGRAVAPLPSGTALDRALEFDTGGFQAGSAVSEWFVRHFLCARGRIHESVIIIEDTIARSDDQNIKRSAETKFFCDGHVFYFLNSGGFSASTIPEVLYASRSFLTIGFFVKARIEKKAVFHREVHRSLLTKLASEVEEIFVSAYDGESFIVWSRASRV